jgi:phage terminase large subunit
VNFDQNPWFPEELRVEMEWDKRRDPDKYKHIWLGEYLKNSEARVFHNWRIEAFDTPPDARFYFGGDWGFSVDPTVLVRSWFGPDGRTLYIDAEAYKVGCEIDYTPALFAGDDTHEPPRWENPKKWPGIPGATKWQIRADSARPETISYMQRKGFKIQPARKGPGSIEDGIEFLKSVDMIVHPDCTHTADELALYSYKTDKLTDEVLPVLEDKKNHVIDALRYAHEDSRVIPFKWNVNGKAISSDGARAS